MAKRQTSSEGSAQDRAKVAGGQDHGEAKKTGASKDAVKGAVKAVGNSRKKLESKLAG